jgi:pimeloyl-ACP methyl ester carboxylesterase
MSLALTVAAAVLACVACLAAGLVLFTRHVRDRAEAAVPPLGRFVDVGGTRLHIVERGSGPALVLVHGLAAQMRNFTYALVDLLAKKYHVVCVDRPGCGYSTRPVHVPATLIGQADTIAKLVASLKLDKPVIVGHSYGGALALAMALNHPDCVGGLALIAPLTHPQNAVPAAFRDLVIHSRWVRQLVGWTLATPVSMLSGTRALDLVFAPDAAPADFSTAAGGDLWLRPGQFIAASADLVGVNGDLPHMVRRYGSIRVPVAILFGRGDRILSHEDHGIAMQSKVDDLVLTLVEGGHMLPLAAPGPTAAWIDEFAQRALGGHLPAG